MRPLRLDMHGFTVFREPTTIDFTDADFFVLVGATGSGKSTVLDAICFALYGTVPRWNDRRAVAMALAPSAASARVRLVFEAAGLRYAATRVVRRDGKGRVSTSHAGLELLPRGFDPTALDPPSGDGDAGRRGGGKPGGAGGGHAGTGGTAAHGSADPAPAALGEPLAGTPAEMERAVHDVLGLPYEQFITCVLLPQGAFAEFLHARPAARQQILVSLLGLSVYEEIRDKATALAAEADTRLAATDRLLADLSDASDEALEQARQRRDAARDLAAAVATAVPDLLAARQAADTARTVRDGLDAELDLLARVRPPAGVAELGLAAARARQEADDATAAVLAAEEHEEKLRAQAGQADDAATLRRVLDEHAERDKLVGTLGRMVGTLAVARREHADALAALERAGAAAGLATDRVTEAEQAVERARTADRAATLRPHLRVGHPCPVCTQPVAALPPAGHSPELAAAQQALRDAQDGERTAARAVQARDRAARELDGTLTRMSAEHDALRGRLTDLDTRLAAGPDPQAAQAGLAAIADLQRDLDDAAGAVRAARDAAHAAAGRHAAATSRVRAAWRDFDAARDAVAALAPPAADRDDLPGSWTALAGWAGGQAAERTRRRAEAEAGVAAAEAATVAAGDRITTLFTAAGLPAPTDPAQAVGAAAVAVERAHAGHERLVERRAQADRLRADRAGHEREGQVARALAGHLRANNFERWLLAEALDLLVAGASTILRELSGGQYDLVHERGEFFVVDNHDAGLRRGVRTLSGGETFQASLALALALSHQLAGMASGTTSLESIILDEGFGTLDTATLDTVAATLETLAARGDRMVGVVTHVSALAQRIPVRFEVTKDARSARVERTGS